ncbi:MAG TPA: hypothetical protein VL332_05755 [Candidatus Saccharimonadaceae bacterium]|nr:hypothetical protein [Candidatus Saccharimonadaceae bacterium]
MRRAMVALAFTAILSTVLAVRGDGEPKEATSVNGVGLIDYTDRSACKLGTWCKYQVTGQSQMGMHDDYTVVVAIAGEERFWGEDCFWVETVTEPRDGSPSVVAQLMSYDIFSDENPTKNMKYYMRKVCSEVDEEGRPIMVVMRRPPTTLTTRGEATRNDPMRIDTLAADTTIQAAKGEFKCRHVRINEGIGSSLEQRDSTVFTEVRESRDVYVSKQIPLTRVVIEDIVHQIGRRTWLVGRSQDAPMNILDRASGRSLLIGYGNDYKAGVVPERFRKSLAEQDRGAAAAVRTPALSSTKRTTPGAKR